MKVLHIITGLSTGGAEKTLYHLLRGGFSKRFSCHVISLSDEGTIGPQIKALGVPVTALGMSRGWQALSGMPKLYRLLRLVKSFRPDLIQGWMYHGNLAATLARALAPGRPVLAWNIHNSLYNLRYEKLMTRQVIRANRLFSYSPDALLYVSQVARKQHEIFGFASSNGWVIPNGINVLQFCFSSESRKRIRLELGIPADAPVVGHVARLHPMKDHPLFFRVAVELISRYTKTHFLLSGQNVSFENKKLAQLVPKEVCDRFHLLGERSDVPDLMSAMDVFCQSSWSEALPNVLCEAMAVGVPCVATDVGDSAYIVGDTSVVVPPRNPEALVEGLRKLIEMGPSQRQLLGRAARKRIEENFSLSMMVKRYIEMYEEIVTSK